MASTDTLDAKLISLEENAESLAAAIETIELKPRDATPAAQPDASDSHLDDHDETRKEPDANGASNKLDEDIEPCGDSDDEEEAECAAHAMFLAFKKRLAAADGRRPVPREVALAKFLAASNNSARPADTSTTPAVGPADVAAPKHASFPRE